VSSIRAVSRSSRCLPAGQRVDAPMGVVVTHRAQKPHCALVTHAQTSSVTATPRQAPNNAASRMATRSVVWSGVLMWVVAGRPGVAMARCTEGYSAATRRATSRSPGSLTTSASGVASRPISLTAAAWSVRYPGRSGALVVCSAYGKKRRNLVTMTLQPSRRLVDLF
jgi:hypothetical protein